MLGLNWLSKCNPFLAWAPAAPCPGQVVPGLRLYLPLLSLDSRTSQMWLSALEQVTAPP